MKEPHQRLQEARIAAGYETAADAARAMGVNPPTYVNHESGERGLSRAARQYAQFFRVSLDWLLRGKGDMRGRNLSPTVIPVTGLVGAGAAVEQIGDRAGWDAPDQIELPGDGSLAALKISGDSQYPRFMDGEFILYDTRPVPPKSLLGRYAIVQTVDGRRLVKMLRRGIGEDRWTLWSHNAPAEENVELLGAWRYLGSLPGR